MFSVKTYLRKVVDPCISLPLFYKTCSSLFYLIICEGKIFVLNLTISYSLQVRKIGGGGFGMYVIL